MLHAQMKRRGTGSPGGGRPAGETGLGLARLAAPHQAAPHSQHGRGREHGGKSMYKTPKINTIFIVDMLQIQVPRQLQVAVEERGWRPLRPR